MAKDEVSAKPLLDKLGVKRGSRVSVVGIDDERFWRELNERTAEVAKRRPRGDSDLVFFAVRTREDLQKLAGLQRSIKKDGAIWAVWRKGQQALKESDIIALAADAGLVDVKVVKFSESHSALKLVIPVSRR